MKSEPAKNLIGGKILFFHDGFDSLPDKGELVSEQARLYPADKFMDSEQGMQLRHGEPESGQLMVLILGGITLNSVEDIAIMFFVVANRCPQLIAHFFKNPFNRWPGTFHPGLQGTSGNRIPVGQKEGVQGIDAVKLIHYSKLYVTHQIDI